MSHFFHILARRWCTFFFFFIVFPNANFIQILFFFSKSSFYFIGELHDILTRSTVNYLTRVGVIVFLWVSFKISAGGAKWSQQAAVEMKTFARLPKQKLALPRHSFANLKCCLLLTAVGKKKNLCVVRLLPHSAAVLKLHNRRLGRIQKNCD